MPTKLVMRAISLPAPPLLCLHPYNAPNPSMEPAEDQSLDATLISDSEVIGLRNPLP
jgi:hypothetical protein